MNVRESRQQEALLAYLSTPRQRSIVLGAPRLGKCRIGLSAIKQLSVKNVLIAYPRKDIQQSWEDEMEAYGLRSDWQMDIKVSYTTFASLHKVDISGYDFLVIDEIHECSTKQLQLLEPMVEKLPTLALTGTLTERSQNKIAKYTGLGVCWKYTIKEAVEDGILADYQIFVHEVPLSSRDKALFDSNERLRIKLVKDGKDTFFIDLRQIGILQRAKSKLEKTKELIEANKDGRLMVFCGVTDIADALGIDVYHSKKKEIGLLNRFAKGLGVDKLATIRMVQAGITIKPIDLGIVNYISGASESATQKIARFLGYEYDNPGKIARIHIVSSTEPFERMRLRTALQWFDESKISYV